jgi:hypothetical protein
MLSYIDIASSPLATVAQRVAVGSRLAGHSHPVASGIEKLNGRVKPAIRGCV